jgi:hypothetical protein
MNTYRKTKEGRWVVYGPATDVRAGASVTVTTKAGKTKTERIVSTGKTFTVDGRTMVYGYTEETSGGSSTGSRNRGCTCGLHRSYRRCQTDGNCSSFGSGESCGGCDCDGY